MNLQHSLRRRELQIEALNIQKDHLLVIRARHRNWISDADNSKINRLRLDIIGSIEKTLAQYDNLLKALQEKE